MHYSIYSTCCRGDAGPYRGWGIRLEGAPLLQVPDISDDRRFVGMLAAVLNRERVEPVHVYDVICDLLSEPWRQAELLGAAYPAQD